MQMFLQGGSQKCVFSVCAAATQRSNKMHAMHQPRVLCGGRADSAVMPSAGLHAPHEHVVAKQQQHHSQSSKGKKRRAWHVQQPDHCVTAQAANTTSSAEPASHAAGTLQLHSSSLITFAEVQQAARNRGMCLSLEEWGPFYRITCTRASNASTTSDRTSKARPAQAAQGDGQVLALTTGFVAPLFGLMHCDTLQVFTRGLRGDEGQRVRGGVLGLGLLMGGAVFSLGLSKGCRKAEILAINDDDSMHTRLVTYYRYFGFEPVRVVEGDTLSDLPHMLVWGGAGTRMDADVQRMLRKWTPALRRAALGLDSQQEQ